MSCQPPSDRSLARGRRCARVFAPWILSWIALSEVGPAQCAPQWQVGEPVPGVRGHVYAMTSWDSDGPGPAPVLLVLGGDFEVAGTAVSNGIATYDPATGAWGTLNTGFEPNSRVHGFTILPNNALWAAGSMRAPGGATTIGIVEFSPTGWQPRGSIGFGESVYSLSAQPNGDVFAGGTFVTINGVVANRIARWDGFSWGGLAGGFPGQTGAVNALASLPNGTVIAGGSFPGANTSYIAQWNGTTWSGLGTGTNDIVNSLVVRPNGNVVAGGRFSIAGGLVCRRIASWDGTSWSPLSSGVDGQAPFGQPTAVHAIGLRASGTLVVGGTFDTAGGFSTRAVAEWDGTGWRRFLSGLEGTVAALAEMPSGDLYFGGLFASSRVLPAPAPVTPAQSVIRWAGSAWSALGSGTIGFVRASASLPDGDLVIGGFIPQIAGVAVRNIARWRTTGWQSLGSGTSGPVYALASLPGGDLVAGGNFVVAGGNQCNGIARWNGSTWSPLGVGCNGSIFALVVLPNGDVVAGGSFTSIGGVAASNIARWNGSTWSTFGVGAGNGVSGPVIAMLARANGELFVGGDLFAAGGQPVNRVARWTGAGWASIGNGLPGATVVNAFAELRNGDVVAAGGTLLNTSESIARWDGTTWSAFAGSPPGPGAALLALPDGGFLLGSGLNQLVYRWNGTLSALSVTASTASAIHTLHLTTSGQIAVGGNFATIGGVQASALAILDSPCAPSAVIEAPGCASSAGAVRLVPLQLPWLGDAFLGRTSGIPASALGIGIWGLAPAAVPLSSLLPQGIAGCQLAASPDVLQLLLPAGGQVLTTLPVPITASLTGQLVRHQVATVELGVAGSVAAVAVSNSLLLRLGNF
jgi:trimeric autotransporter adhesin